MLKYKLLLSGLLITVLFSSYILLNKTKPTLYIIGDSTVRNTNRPQCGWGEKIVQFLDTNKITISNQAMAGRSTRTFIKEGRWDKVMSTIQKGDYVIMQFGHNEGSKPDTSKAGRRGVLRGIGEETLELTWPDSAKEIVHTYGWYIRKFINDAKAKGAIPIVASMIPRNEFRNDKVLRADKDFGKWAQDVAIAEGIDFINLNEITATKYETLGPEKVKEFFPGDHTHTNEAGAALNAASVIDGIKLLKKNKLNKYIIQK